LGKGYTYDLVNTEVLLTRLSVEDGDLVLPDGMRYRVLAVDLEDETVPPKALRKIVELAEDGATVVLGRRRPIRAPGLHDYPACDEEVGRLAGALWADSSDSPRTRPLGQGKIVRGTAIDDALRAEGIARDFEGPWDYLHRREGELDLYFLAGSGHAECTFRAGGREPELWDPTTGEIRDAVWFRPTGDGRTVVPIRLPENGSVFVVFRKPLERRHVVSVSAEGKGMEIEGRTESGVRLCLWQLGRYVLATSEKGQAAVEVKRLPKPQTLAGPWEVRFPSGWGAPESITFDSLTPWNEHTNEGIRYFSGTAGYRGTFQLDEHQAAGLVRLRLGRVGHVAEVHVNGTPLGVVWTDPWTVDLTGIANPGRNELKIDVTNVWVNRLVGDVRLPPEKRLTRTNVGFFPDTERLRPHRGFNLNTPLEPSGLMGPVTIEFGEHREVQF
jgi:hypothetical protein